MKSAASDPDPNSNSVLRPNACAVLEQIRASGFPGWSVLGLEASRTAILQMEPLGGLPEPDVSAQQIEIPRPDGSMLEATRHAPKGSGLMPAMVYMHGGGGCLGTHKLVTALCSELAHTSHSAVVSIEYRLAPEHKYPAGLEDVLTALNWVVSNGQEHGLDNSCVALGGDSSGANLACAASLRCRDQCGPKIAYQLLVYPVLDHNYATNSYVEFGDGSSSALSRADVEWFHSLYVNTPAELDLPYVSPLRAHNLAGLPPTLLIAAEVDPLVDDGLLLEQLLRQAGVPVQRSVYPGMFHGFWRLAGVIPEARQAVVETANQMRRFIARTH